MGEGLVWPAPALGRAGLAQPSVLGRAAGLSPGISSARGRPADRAGQAVVIGGEIVRGGPAHRASQRALAHRPAAGPGLVVHSNQGSYTRPLTLRP